MTTSTTSTQTAFLKQLLAPISGHIVPLEMVPDPVFAEKMIGDGIAIDPVENCLYAPCDGVIAATHASQHAVTVKSADGKAILMHVGIDTVMMKGEGFNCLVKQGDSVSAGQKLIEFDLDLVAQRAPSLLTMVIVSEGSDTITQKRAAGSVTSRQDAIISFDAVANIDNNQEHCSDWLYSDSVEIINIAGVHARPAARLSAKAKAFQAQVMLQHGDKQIKASSVVDLMSLGLEKGAKISFCASGPEAKLALDAICLYVKEGLGEDPNHAPSTESEQERFSSDDASILGGVPASPGLAYGQVWRQQRSLPEFEQHSQNPTAEFQQLRDALAQARAQLNSLTTHFEQKQQIEKAQIFAAHEELLDDPVLLDASKSFLKKGASAASAWQKVIHAQAATLKALKNPLMRQRADDLEDVGYRVMMQLLGITPERQSTPEQCVLVTDDLSPSDTAYIDTDKVVALVTRNGGASSHAAIIARSMGVPFVAGLDSQVEALQDGQTVIVDGHQGSIKLNPGDQQLLELKQAIKEHHQEHQRQLAMASQRATTVDGHEVEVAVNIGSLCDAQQGVAQGADGVGLLRSEFLFLNRREAPNEQQQSEVYEGIAKVLGKQRSLVVRTLDVGGDKPLSYMPMTEEENPFLGVRGIRLSLAHPELLRTQVRAVLKAAAHTQLHIMFPMIAQLKEFRRAKLIVLEELGKLNRAGAGIREEDVKIGLMVEVPSAAMMADVLAQEADFFSIGTNDLTQYCLAMDRGHPQLAAQANALDPAVLKMIDITVKGAHQQGKWVGVCGGIAAEPLAAPLLIGLGVDELSVPAPAIPELKARIRQLSLAQCKLLAAQALALSDAASVRTLLKTVE